VGGQLFSPNPCSEVEFCGEKKVGQKTLNLTGKLFLLNVCGFCRGKNSKNSDRDGKIFGRLVFTTVFRPRVILNFHQTYAMGFLYRKKF
jgi:hypothetical protein